MRRPPQPGSIKRRGHLPEGKHRAGSQSPEVATFLGKFAGILFTIQENGILDSALAAGQSKGYHAERPAD
jgi:hypothetical protein